MRLNSLEGRGRKVLGTTAATIMGGLLLAGCGGSSSNKKSEYITPCDVATAKPELVADPLGVLSAFTIAGEELITAYISQPPESSDETPAQLKRGYQLKVAARQLIQFDQNGDLTPNSFLAQTSEELFCTIPVDPNQPDGKQRIALSEEAVIANATLTEVGYPPQLKGLIVQQ